MRGSGRRIKPMNAERRCPDPHVTAPWRCLAVWECSACSPLLAVMGSAIAIIYKAILRV